MKVVMLAAGLLPGIGVSAGQVAPAPLPCTPAWFAQVEARLGSGDGRGHGPDVASDEWRSVVEFRLGVRGNAEVPDRASAAWCEFIDALIRHRPSPGRGDQ